MGFFIEHMNRTKALVVYLLFITITLGGTRTDKALRLAEREFFCDSCRRDGVPQVLLVITDGNTNIGSEDLGIASIGMKVIQTLISVYYSSSFNVNHNIKI